MESKLRDEMDDLNLFYLDQLKRKNAELEKVKKIKNEMFNVMYIVKSSD